jgi:hypothetical protein
MAATRNFPVRITPAKLAYYAALPEISEMSRQARGHAAGAAHVVYIIINPAAPDPLGAFAGMPMYVGMSANIERRVLRHYQCAAFRRLRRGSIRWRINRLLKQGTLVRFVVAARFDSLIEAEIAEIHQSQQLIAAGYRLLNRLPVQSTAMSEQQLADVAARRRALFALRRGA